MSHSIKLGRRLQWGTRGTAAATIAARLRFESVSHAYDEISVIHDVSLDIEPGEIIGLLGSSGCGKTTLLRIASGIERQTAGRILINEREMAGPNSFLLPEERGVGLVFQDYALFPHMTVLDNVAFGLTRLDHQQAELEARATLRRVGLEHYATAYPHMLSGGEQQRVALARAIAPRPSVLMMDEPFSGLDRRLRDEIRDETLTILRETRATCILVTHDPEEAMRLSDRIVLMRSGRFAQVGTPRALYQNPVDIFVASFFSKFNRIAGEINGNGIVTPVGFFPKSYDGTADQTMEVCIRPQGVLLSESGISGCIGRVLRYSFLGDINLVEVAVEGLDFPLIAYVHPAISPPPGKEVKVSFNLEHVLVFPSSEEV